MKELKLKDVPMRTLDRKPLVVGMKVFRSEIKEPYRESMSLLTTEWIIEYINASGRVYMAREQSEGIERRFSNGACNFYSSIEASKKELKEEVSQKIREIEKKIKHHSINLKFLRSL